MHGKYDRGLMARGEAARRCISNGEDPFMLLQAVWPDHEWAESAMFASLSRVPDVVARRAVVVTVEAPAA